MEQDATTKRDLAIGLAVTAALLFASLLLGVFSGEARTYDFGTLYAAAWMVNHGMASSLYDLNAQAAIQGKLLNRGTANVYFLQPPFEALLLAPLAWFSYSRAYILWGV